MPRRGYEIPNRLHWGAVLRKVQILASGAFVVACATLFMTWLGSGFYGTTRRALSAAPPEPANVTAAAQTLSYWVSYLSLFILCAVFLFTAARYYRVRISPLQGIAFGTTVAGLLQGFYYVFTPHAFLWELSIFIALAALGGYVGATIGNQALSSEQALLNAMQSVNDALTPEDIAASLGTNLTARGLKAVSLWRKTGLRTYEMFAAWSHDTTPAWSMGISIDPDTVPTAKISNDSAWVPMPKDQQKPPPWWPQATRSCLITPLSSASREPFGFMLTAFYTASRPDRSTIRDIGVAAATVAEAVEHRRLGALQERQQVGRDIHDTLAADLTHLGTTLEAFSSHYQWSKNQADELRSLVDTARAAREQTRNLAYGRQPIIDGHASLPDALHALVNQQNTKPSTLCHLDIEDVAQPIPVRQSRALWLVAKEAVANVEKHAKAANVTIKLATPPDGFYLEVSDDGDGFDQIKTSATGLGRHSMASRVELLGGNLLVNTQPGRSTSILAMLPAGDSRPQTSSAPEAYDDGSPLVYGRLGE